MIKKSKPKDQKPVNISISFNIHPKQIAKEPPYLKSNKNIDNEIKGKKIRNEQVIKSHRDSNFNQYPYIPLSITNRRKAPQLNFKLEQNNNTTDRHTIKPQDLVITDQIKSRKKIKRQSMDGLFDIKKKSYPQSLQNRVVSIGLGRKPELLKTKLTPISSKRKMVKVKPLKANLSVPSSTKNQLMNVKIETSVLKNVLINSTRDKSKMSIDNLKKMISKLVSQQVRKQQETLCFKNIKPKLPIANQKASKLKLNQKLRKPKSHNRSLQLGKKKSKSKLQNQQLVQEDIEIKLSSFKSINGSLLTSQISEGQAMVIHNNGTNNMLMKTSASNAQLQVMVKQNYPIQKINLKSKQQRAVIKIQRCWRQYRTRTLVNLYIDILNQNGIHGKYFMDQIQHYQEDLKQPEKSSVVDEFNQQYKFQQGIQQKKLYSQIKQFHSYQIPKDEEVQRILQFKKKQISKWQQTLNFIENHLNQNNMKEVLIQVFHQLENNKNHLEDDIKLTSRRNKDQKKGDLASFTIPLQSSKQCREKDDVANIQQDKELSQLRESYVVQDKNQDIMIINLSNINLALDAKKKKLQQRKIKQLSILQAQLQLGKIDNKQFQKQKERLDIWIKHEQKDIIRAKKQLEQGYQQIKKVVERNKKDEIFLNRLKKNNQLTRCLSDNYIKLLPLQKITQITQHKNIHEKIQPLNQFQGKKIDEISQQLLIENAGKLNEKLKNLSQEKESPEISYQSVSKQYEQSQQQEQEHIIKNQLKFLSKENQTQKLKNLEQADRQDIFQFVFLDLCIQFCQQVYQEPEKLKKIINFISIKKKPPTKKFKGIKTNINIVKQYLKQFLSFMARTNKQTFDRIIIPMGPSAIQMLKYMHFYDEDQNQEQEDLIGTLVLSTSLFESFQTNLLSGLQFQPYYDDQQKQANRIQFLKGVIHIHNKAIFDALNESLDLQRPFGIWGKPFPWKKVAEFSHQFTQSEKQTKFKNASEKVIQYCTYVCGIIIDKEQSLVAPGLRLSQDYIEQIKQDRLSKMLANDLIQNEQRWVFYDDQQTEVMVELGYLIYEILTKQAAQQILRIGSERIIADSFEMLED